MKCPERLRRRLLVHALVVMARRDPDVIIGSAGDPYMHRWYILPRNRWFNLYLHRFWRSDDDRALHDHPWWNASLLLEGAYVEHTIERGGINRRERLEGGAIRFRPAKAAHRIELDRDEGGAPLSCVTLFATGPRIRDWGFHCPKGWVPWRIFTAEVPARPGEPRISSIGRGCGEDGHD